MKYKMIQKLLAMMTVALCGRYADHEALSQTPGDWKIRADKLAESVVDPTALTIVGYFGPFINGKSFQQEAFTTLAGWQYVAYYDANRHVCLARRELSDSSWQFIRFEDYALMHDDVHNTISMGICPKDGTIHLSFDHHNHPLHYRVSRKGVATAPEQTSWEPSLFGPVIAELEKGKPPSRVCYPRFWRTPEGGFQFCYRVGGSGGGDRTLVDYDPATGSWRNTRQIDSRAGTFSDSFNTSHGRCSYPNGYTYDVLGRLHVTWVWREATQGANHDLMHAYSEDRGFTWKNSQGQLVGDSRPGGRPLCLDSPGIVVVPIGRGFGLLNTQAQAVDSQGRIHVVISHLTEEPDQPTTKFPGWLGPPEDRRYHHYWRANDGVWQHTELPGAAGNPPKLFFDRHDNAILIANLNRPGATWPMPIKSWGTIDEFCFFRGDLTIMAATAASKWKDWQVIHTEAGPFVNEMLGDSHRWHEEAVLSIMVQETPQEPREPTPLRILDFRFAVR